MKIPEKPPLFEKLNNKIMAKYSSNLPEIIRMLSDIGPTDKEGRYHPWRKIKYHLPPDGLDPEEHWWAIKQARKKIYKYLPLKDQYGKSFCFCVPDALQRELHWLDQQASGNISMDKPITNPHTRKTYVVNSLIEEAIHSSQLEGAATTRTVAKAMLRENRPPKDHSEQMIYNNFHAMEMIEEFKSEKLTPAFIKKLHEILTEKTLSDANKAGQYRDSDDIKVVDNETILHIPPESRLLNERIENLCAFANSANEKEFIHPVIKSILLHFMIGYEHPFVDGNGRTARALFYWSMLKNGYWLMQFISISKPLKEAPKQYVAAYLDTETDDNDLTYFIFHQVAVIKKAIIALYDYLQKKGEEMEEAEKLLAYSKAKGQLNHRQLLLLEHALKNPGATYEIKQHQAAHRISYQTARNDLLKMSDKLNLLRKRTYGKTFVFVSPPDLKTKLTENNY